MEACSDERCGSAEVSTANDVVIATTGMSRSLAPKTKGAAVPLQYDFARGSPRFGRQGGPRDAVVTLKLTKPAKGKLTTGKTFGDNAWCDLCCFLRRFTSKPTVIRNHIFVALNNKRVF